MPDLKDQAIVILQVGGYGESAQGDVTMKKNILDIDDHTFDSQVLKSDKPVLVDLWAPWCGPCNSIEPVVEKLAEAYGDQIRFTRCNVDHNPNTTKIYRVKGIPTLMFFKGGKLVDKLTGLVPMSIIEDAISKCLSGSELAEPVTA
jgi:thioredoxin 1